MHIITFHYSKFKQNFIFGGLLLYRLLYPAYSLLYFLLLLTPLSTFQKWKDEFFICFRQNHAFRKFQNYSF